MGYIDADFDIENSVDTVGVHYSATLWRWYRNWLGNADKVKATYGQRWFRVSKHCDCLVILLLGQKLILAFNSDLGAFLGLLHHCFAPGFCYLFPDRCREESQHYSTY